MGLLVRTTQWVFRRFCNSSDRYHIAQRCYLWTLKAFRRTHEQDFLVFRSFKKSAPLFVDVGANVGQAAVSISVILPEARIISFEANRTLEPEIERTKQMLGDKFEFRMCALGPENTTMNLIVPKFGNLSVETRASLARSSFAGSGQSTEEIEVDVLRFDDLNLRPDVIKIDVEGFEAEVLKGMTKTIGELRPIMLIEKSESFLACRDILAPFDYEFFVRSDKTGKLIPSEMHQEAVNFFAIPKNSDQFNSDIFDRTVMQ